jgi:hypothetical protein
MCRSLGRGPSFLSLSLSPIDGMGGREELNKNSLNIRNIIIQKELSRANH